MTRWLVPLVLSALFLLPVRGQAQGFQDPLLERLAGRWVMTGVIDGQQITHDIEAEWVLAHHYLRMHEVARETDAHGDPAYEAIVLIGRHPKEAGYACLWLDVTGGEGLDGDAIGHARRAGDSMPFVFDLGEAGAILNTFSYDAEADAWDMAIDIERAKARTVFARVRLVRADGDAE